MRRFSRKRRIGRSLDGNGWQHLHRHRSDHASDSQADLRDRRIQGNRAGQLRASHPYMESSVNRQLPRRQRVCNFRPPTLCNLPPPPAVQISLQINIKVFRPGLATDLAFRTLGRGAEKVSLVLLPGIAMIRDLLAWRRRGDRDPSHR